MNEESNLMDIQVFATNTVNYALQQNRIPVVQKISILGCGTNGARRKCSRRTGPSSDSSGCIAAVCNRICGTGEKFCATRPAWNRHMCAEGYVL